MPRLGALYVHCRSRATVSVEVVGHCVLQIRGWLPSGLVYDVNLGLQIEAKRGVLTPEALEPFHFL